MSKHTPGPWSYYTEPQPNGCPIVGNGKGLMVAMLAHSINYNSQAAEAIANASLIAAAPELLEALRDVQAAIYMDDAGQLRLARSFDEDKLTAVIAKATGEQQ